MAAKKRFTAGEQARRLPVILEGLEKSYPDAQCALRHRNDLELLIATILSAQCTDERVNKLTQTLFEKYRTPSNYVRVQPRELENDIRPTGFFRNKAKSIQGACRMILEKFGGRVPDTMEELIQLPGVARKTANVLLGVIHGKAEGIVVDTHVFRIARRLELSNAKTPEKVEQDLMCSIPRNKWIGFAHQMIFHGRRVCHARKPLCHLCSVEKVCQSKDKILAFPPTRPRRKRMGV